MHEVSSNYFMTDFITGSEVEVTTYEDLRQQIARIMVEEKGYPREMITVKLPLSIAREGNRIEYTIDYVVYVDEKPALLVAFCAGAVLTYTRQYQAAAMLVPPTPPPFFFVTDTKEGILGRTSDGKRLGEEFNSLPPYEHLKKMVAHTPTPEVDEKTRKQAENIVHAFFAFSAGECCSDSCP